MHGTCASAEQRIRRACAVADSLGMSAAAQVHTAILQLAAAARSAAQSHVAARLRVPDAAVRLLLACLEALHTVSFLDVSLTLTVLAAAVCVGSPAGMRLGKAPRRRPRSSVLQPGSAMRTQILHLSAMKLFPPHSCKWSADLQERLDGRWVLECGGGGNCLFHVLSFLLHGRPDFHEELRAAVAEFFGTTDNAQHEVYKNPGGDRTGRHRRLQVHVDGELRRSAAVVDSSHVRQLPLRAARAGPLVRPAGRSGAGGASGS